MIVAKKLADGNWRFECSCENLDATTVANFGEPPEVAGKSLVWDMNRVEFADSAGLGLLRSLCEAVGDGEMILENVSFRLELCLRKLPQGVLDRMFKSPSDLPVNAESAPPNSIIEETWVTTNSSGGMSPTSS